MQSPPTSNLLREILSLPEQQQNIAFEMLERLDHQGAAPLVWSFQQLQEAYSDHTAVWGEKHALTQDWEIASFNVPSVGDAAYFRQFSYQELPAYAYSQATASVPAEIPEDSLGFMLREHRLEKGYSQKQLAESLGVSTSLISAQEKNELLPSISQLRQEKKLLEIPDDDFLKMIELRQHKKLGHHKLSDDGISLGKHIAYQRNLLNIDQRSFAAQAGVDDGFLCNVENDKAMPSLEWLEKIAQHMPDGDKLKNIWREINLKSIDQDSVGAYIKYHRVSEGKTQQALADETGVSRSNIAKIERNEITPTPEFIERIQQVLPLDGEKLQQLYQEKTTPPPPDENATAKEKLSYWRKKAGLTLQEVGDKIGVTKSVVSRYESGTIQPPEALKEILGIPEGDWKSLQEEQQRNRASGVLTGNETTIAGKSEGQESFIKP